MTSAFSSTLTGVESAVASFAGLRQSVKNRVVRRSVTAGTRPAVKAVKAELSGRLNDTGTLRKNIGSKVVTYSSGVVSGIVGPKALDTSVVAWSKSKRTFVRRNPKNYAHLLELGHRVAVHAKKGFSVKDHVLLRRNGRQIGLGKSFASTSGFVYVRPFMAPAFHKSKFAQLAQFQKFATQGIMQEVAKAEAKAAQSK